MRLRKLRMFAHLSTQTEIPKFYIVTLIDEDISRFDISMKNFAAFPFLIQSPIMTILQSK